MKGKKKRESSRESHEYFFVDHANKDTRRQWVIDSEKDTLH